MRARRVSADAGGEQWDVDGAECPIKSVEQMRDGETISTQRYKDLLAHLAGAVAIITTRDAIGQTWGFTASSFCSLSLDPPLVLFCLAHAADCHAAFLAAERFAVSILSADQSGVSQRFAQKGSIKYEGIRFEMGSLGMPLIPAALAWLECRAYATYPGGDHTIIVGQVEQGRSGRSDGDSNGDARPLLYFDRSYGTFQRDEGGL